MIVEVRSHTWSWVRELEILFSQVLLVDQIEPICGWVPVFARSKDRYDHLPTFNISAITKWFICNNFNRGYHIAHLIVVHCCIAVSLNIPRHYCDSYVGFTGVECKNANLWELFPYECLRNFGLTVINKQSKVSAIECHITWSYHDHANSSFHKSHNYTQTQERITCNYWGTPPMIYWCNNKSDNCLWSSVITHVIGIV